MERSESDVLVMRLLSEVRLFEGLERPDMVTLLGLVEKEVFRPGEIVVSEGETGNTMYVVLSGSAEVSRTGSDGHRRHLANLGPGDSLGEMALVDHSPRSATVRAVEACVTLRLASDRLMAAPQVGARLYRNIARVLAMRLKRANDLLLFAGGSTTRSQAATEAEVGSRGAGFPESRIGPPILKRP